MAGYTIPDTAAAQDITELGATPHTLFYADGTGVVQELALGANGEVLTSQGPAAAPAFAAAAGGGGGGISLGLALALG